MARVFQALPSLSTEFQDSVLIYTTTAYSHNRIKQHQPKGKENVGMFSV